MAKKKESAEDTSLKVLSDKEKNKLIENAWKILDAGESEASMLSDAISNINSFDDSGCCVLNILLSGRIRGGGFPEGRLSVLAAPSSVGKSYIGLQAAAIAQRKGKRILIFDSENAIDTEFAQNLGLDVNAVKYFPVRSIEQCKNNMFAFLDFVEKNKLKGQFFILVDSLAAMMSEMDFTRLENESTGSDMGTRAKSLRAFIQMMTTMSARTQTTIICTNHIFDNPGQTYPSIEKNMSGGRAVKYFSSTLLQLSAKQVKSDDKVIKTGDEASSVSKGMTGIAIGGISIKNRIVKPYMEGNMYISWQKGLRKYFGLLDIAIKLGLLFNRAGKIYIPATDTEEEKFVGNRTKIETDKVFWESFIPTLEEAVKKEFCYNALNVDFNDDEEPIEDVENDVDVEEDDMD